LRLLFFLLQFASSPAEKREEAFMPVCKPRPDLSFLRLQTAVFCVQCELIAENATPCCLACGSTALLSLSRLLGGSLRRQHAATLLDDRAMDTLVRDLLATVPAGAESVSEPGALVARSAQPQPAVPDHAAVSPALLDLEPAISVLAQRAQTVTGATGSAIGLRWDEEIVCSARAGRTAPDLGVRLRCDTGLSAECARTGEVVRCDDTEKDPTVDRESCRRLGVRSILVAPLRHLRSTLGIFEVLSSEPHAFDDWAAVNLQLLSGFMVAAIGRAAGIRRSAPLLP
jgi:GAF domain-containing protein